MKKANRKRKNIHIYLDLFLTFAKVGVCTFGGGYAMLPILQREVAESKKWSTAEELADYYAVGQCTPGIIAINTATFAGSKQAGVPGGIIATLGLVFPSLIIIMLVASFLRNFMEIEWVKHAFNGVRAGVVALILGSVIKLLKSAIKDWITGIIYVVALIMAVVGEFVPLPGGILGSFLNFILSPPVVVVMAGIAGVCVRAAKGGLR